MPSAYISLAQTESHGHLWPQRKLGNVVGCFFWQDTWLPLYKIRILLERKKGRTDTKSM